MYVVNETTEHYAVVHSPTYLVWKEETTPVMIYTTAGLMLYNYAGWLDSNRNNQEFTKNERYDSGSKQPIRTRYLGHVTGYQPIRDQYFLIQSIPGMILFNNLITRVFHFPDMNRPLLVRCSVQEMNHPITGFVTSQPKPFQKCLLSGVFINSIAH